jgi:hypothetical protein
MKSCNPQTEPVRRCLLSGLFLSVAEYQREGHYLTVRTIVFFFYFPHSIHLTTLFFFSFATAWISSNGGYPSVVCSLPLETVLHCLHRARSNWQTLRPSSDAYRSRLDRGITQRHTFTAAPSKNRLLADRNLLGFQLDDDWLNLLLFLLFHLDVSRDCQRTASQMIARVLVILFNHIGNTNTSINENYIAVVYS